DDALALRQLVDALVELEPRVLAEEEVVDLLLEFVLHLLGEVRVAQVAAGEQRVEQRQLVAARVRPDLLAGLRLQAAPAPPPPGPAGRPGVRGGGRGGARGRRVKGLS